MAAPDLSALRARFPALARTQDGRPVVFADAPGGSQVPDTVIEAVAGRYREGDSNPRRRVRHQPGDPRGGGRRRARPAPIWWAPTPTDRVRPERDVAAVPRCSARSRGRSGPATRSWSPAWTTTRTSVPGCWRPRDAGATVRWVDLRAEDATLDARLVRRRARRPHPAGGVHPRLERRGHVTPAADLVRAAKAAGALVAVDGVHLAQHRAIDFDALGADLLAVSPYKVFGPHLGMLAAAATCWTAGTLPRAARAGLPVARALGDGHAEPRGARRASWPPSTTWPEVGRDVRRPADGSRRDGGRAAFAAFGEHERALARAVPRRGSAGSTPPVAVRHRATPPALDERTPTFAVRLGDQHPRARPPRRWASAASSSGTGTTTRWS